MLGVLVAALLLAPRPGARPEAPAAAPPPAVGAAGHGLTVLSGGTITRFPVRYLGRLERALPGQDLHLIRLEDPRFDTSGVIAGMSGSPIYFDGRLLGALAYAWTFSREPIAGVTPIEAMRAAAGRSGASPRRAGAPPGFAPVATPVWVAGIPPTALAPLAERWRGAGLDVIPGGAAAAGPAHLDLVPGAAIGVRLIRGDLDATAVGTVTERDGDRVLAFGHPMMGLGTTDLPVSTAVVQAIVSSAARSFKLGSPVRTVGTLVGDDQAAIVARVGEAPAMVPITIRLDGPGGARTLRMEAADHPVLTPFLLDAAWSGAAGAHLWSLGEATWSYEVRAEVEGGGARLPVSYRDVGYGRFSPLEASPLRPLLALADLPDVDVRFRSVEVDARVRLERRTARIADAGLVAPTARPGETVAVWARLDPYGGGEEVVRVEVPLPPRIPPGTYAVRVGAGRGRAGPDRPYPRDLAGWIRAVEEVEPRDALVAEVSLPAAAAEVDGRLLPDLPPTVAAVQADDLAGHAAALRVRGMARTSWVLEGALGLMLAVEPPREEIP